MPNTLEGKLSGAGLSVALVVARFNDAITERLLSSALDCLRRHDVDDNAQVVVRVPGAFEIPVAAQALAKSGRYDAVVCLGALIRGGTSHFDVLASQVTSALGQIQLATEIPIAFGVLTCETVEQALERSGGKGSNKGWDVALVAIEMANLRRTIADFDSRAG